MTALPEFRLESYFSKWEFAARYHLTASDAETMALHELLAFGTGSDRDAWENQCFGYIETRGMPALRAAIAATYERITPDDVMTFAGAEEGLYCAMHAVLDRDSHAIVLVPNYQAMESIPLSLCDVTGVALDAANGWNFDPDSVRAALRPNTRMVAVNFPNNPTGKVISHEQFRELVEICRERNVYLFSDEVFRGIERRPADTLPQACDLYERAISLNVVSKAYGLPGLRVGWIACREPSLLDAMERLKHYLSICNSGPGELLARIAVEATDAIFSRNRALTAENLDRLDAFFARHEALFEWYRPEGSCVAYPAYRGSDGVEAFCEKLVETAGVLLLPGSMYRSQVARIPDGRFRIGYGRRNLAEALTAFDAYLEGAAR